MLPFYTKSKEPWMCTVHAHLYSVLGLESDAVHSLNFDKNLVKNISWNAAKTITQWEISLINLEESFLKCVAQDAIWNLIVIQIEGQLQFIELEDAVLLL